MKFNVELHFFKFRNPTVDQLLRIRNTLCNVHSPCDFNNSFDYIGIFYTWWQFECRLSKWKIFDPHRMRLFETNWKLLRKWEQIHPYRTYLQTQTYHRKKYVFFLRRYFNSLSSLYRGLLAQISTSSGDDFLEIMVNRSLNGYHDVILPN